MKSLLVKNYQTAFVLVGIFLLALILRFLYFPRDIYFGFDQARDAFTSLELWRGHLKIVGPPTGVEGLFHGPLYYYFFAPLYFFSHGDPSWAAAFLRIINASVVFLVFAAGWVVFNRRVGLLSAFLLAISFEQTQYALYFNHPSLAVLSVTLFYLGLGLLFFRKKNWGLILATFGLGLSLQFEFVLIYLFVIFIFLLAIFRKYLSFQKQIWLWSLAAFVVVTSTFILAEIKFGFRALSNLIFLSPVVSEGNLWRYLENINLLGQRFISDNLFSSPIGTPILFVLLVTGAFLLIRKQELRLKIIFLLIWIFGGILPYLNNKSATPLYYYSPGASVGLLILTSFFLSEAVNRFKIWALLILLIPIISNWGLITKNNPFGVIPTINVQSGMLLEEEKRVVDYVYQNSFGQPFAVRALTMPLSINTTWSYLFEWYGNSKYGVKPAWIGPNAEGYPGNLAVVNARSALPLVQFLIIEPTRGVREALVNSFMEEESYFTKVIEEKTFGDITVQRRRPY